jgi:hypothetical protein
MRQMYGSKQGLMYKIKLNDEILEPSSGDARVSPRGKLATGTTVPDTQLIKEKRQQFDEQGKDIWGTSKLSKLGPGQYDVSTTLVKHKARETHFMANKTAEKSFDEKQREEEKMIRIFDGSASTIKNSQPIVPLKPLEVRKEIKAFG